MKKTSDVAFCGVVSSISVVFLILACFAASFSIFIHAICGSLVIITSIKINKKTGYMLYITVCLTSVFLVFSVKVWFMYIIFSGFYPIIKMYIENFKNRVLIVAFKLIVFSVFSVVLILILFFLFSSTYLIEFRNNFFILQQFFSLIIFFYIYDFFVSYFTKRYFLFLDEKIFKNK